MAKLWLNWSVTNVALSKDGIVTGWLCWAYGGGWWAPAQWPTGNERLVLTVNKGQHPIIQQTSRRSERFSSVWTASRQLSIRADYSLHEGLLFRTLQEIGIFWFKLIFRFIQPFSQISFVIFEKTVMGLHLKIDFFTATLRNWCGLSALNLCRHALFK